ncbi:E3 ubiquitin-protein ligase TTC3 isoform X2 [Acanthochromis polyacanthus]|uniref:E3 ubiquitin-protein ligase TTC3 isoform X2 n=1 Tax=Acanthochromis polyacanthus TaxID=80966 RepID=UPI002234C959|nr:E3 ubiquitin-protein ligase TTC3 isoform X2 [Acanthochromis polyacanthus]
MSDSDSGSDQKSYRKMKDDNVITFRPSDVIFEKWNNLPLSIKIEAVQRMKICSFWLPIILQREDSPIAAWAVEIGLVNPKDTEDLSLKQLRKIECVETIIRALERGTILKNQPRHVLAISNRFNLRRLEVMDDALRWLEGTEEPAIRQRLEELGHETTRFSALRLIFTEFAKFVQEMGGSYEKTMKTLFFEPLDYQVEKSNEMKRKGNESFQKQEYEEAVKFYSKAIKFYPDNHFLYGNRALCYIRSKNYLKAVGDGKRAILIKPLWAKGHYRYCEALFLMGEIRMALEGNRLAQSLCDPGSDGMRDLELQHEKFKMSGGFVRGTCIKNPGTHFKAGLVMERPQPKAAKAISKNNPATSSASKVSQGKTEKHSGKNEKHAQKESSAKDTKSSKSDISSKNSKGENHSAVKKKPMNRNSPTREENQKKAESKSDVCGKLRSLVQDAHSALTDQRSRNAEQAFSQALASLEELTAKEFGLSTLDVLLLLFGRVSALTDIGQPEELTEAQKVLEKMKSYEERTFQCLVYYSIGRVYLRENRFSFALQQFSDALQMMKNQITPGKLTWPLTKEIVRETQADYFKEILEGAIELCRFPPPPDAVCRLEKCHSAVKAEIFFRDPDFKGFIQFCCCQSCKVEFHIACWKTLKTSAFSDKNEKDLLQEACLTPDCVGQICSIKIYGPTGLVKCKFEATIPKLPTPKVPKLNQKCTSQKKLKSKEERRLKRKQHKQSFQGNQTINEEILQQEQNTATQSQQKAWLLFRDRVLLQISQHMELLREEKGLQVSALTSGLKPWLQLDSSRGNPLAGRMLNWQQEQLQTLGQAVELLLERRNRVWARVFIQQLSICEEVNPKLNSWACQLNDAGLNAARTFIERYSGHLEELDLAHLLGFGPLQEIIVEKLGTRPEFLSSIGLTVTEFLKQAPPHDMRLFIWTLEEHRDDYVSCHTILDEYFEVMDGHCSVLKKSDENQNNSPLKTKSRGRKKKQKEPKGIIVLSGMRSGTPRDERDQDFFEDDPLSFFEPADPFSVPSHLREQVADFEDQYNGTGHGGLYKNILDNNPDPTKESLYDYFAQILDEHGPLVAEDPLLVGELVNFPPVAQQKIQDAGGFECFLLESLRFIKMGRCIGLAQHAVSLQQAGHGASLDDLDDISDSLDNSPPSDMLVDFETGFPAYDFSSTQPDIYPILPNPYAFGFQMDADSLTHWSSGDSEQAAYYLPEHYEDFYPSEADGVFGSRPGEVTLMATDENFLKRDAEVQTCPEAMRSVAVNTELNERFESCQGDINKLEKDNRKLEKQIKKMSNGCNKVSLSNREDISLLEEDIRKITVNIQVTNKELVLFQQKLEEEVRKDQREKKANQEALKALKLEIEDLVEQQGSLARSIREKKSSYDTKLNDFLEQGNQSEAEKLSLEDEIKRCKALLSSAKRRSQTAKLLVMESNHDQGLYGLYREQADAKALLTKLDEAKHRHPNQDLDLTRNSCRANIEEIEKKISTAERLYKQQIEQVKNGRRTNETPPVSNQPEPAASPLSAAAKEFTPHFSAQTSRGASSPVQKPAPPAAQAPTVQRKPPPRTTEPPRSTVFEKAMGSLATMFPDYTRPDLMRFVQELRSTSGGNLSSMTLQDVVGGATQLILDHQERLNSARSNIVGRGSPAQCATPPLLNPVWQPLGSQRAPNPNALNMEDPCIICHEDMVPEETCVLECRHSFHEECIKSWLKEQSTCPTCRNHALLPEDFPVLPGRRRP